MSRIWISWVLVVGFCGFLAVGASARAAAPWEGLLTMNKVEADPEKTYQLTDENGPWMIMTTSFSGEGAQQQAHDLVLELRRRYKLPAYQHRVKFDFGREAPGRGLDEFGNPIKMRYQSGTEVDEIAVLVGDYPSVNCPEAQRTLQKIKNSRPECLDIKKRKQTNQSLASWRILQNEFKKAIGSGEKQRGPMGHAFVTTNPLLPKEYYVPRGVDPFILKMNKGVKHSLLDCPGRYTVQVATFKGRTVLDQKEIQEELQKGLKIQDSKLAEAADKAHRLTEALRMKGYDAFEFHDRYSSIVTVGSFHSVGTPRPDGRTEINPKIHAIMEAFKAQKPEVAGLPQGALEPQSLVGIPFDIQPIPVQVPKRSVSTALNRQQAQGLW